MKTKIKHKHSPFLSTNRRKFIIAEVAFFIIAAVLAVILQADYATTLMLVGFMVMGFGAFSSASAHAYWASTDEQALEIARRQWRNTFLNDEFYLGAIPLGVGIILLILML